MVVENDGKWWYYLDTIKNSHKQSISIKKSRKEEGDVIRKTVGTDFKIS